jgi:hypothetical protein
MSKMILDRTRNGLGLPEKEREKLVGLKKRIMSLEVDFQRNCNEEKGGLTFTAQVSLLSFRYSVLRLTRGCRNSMEYRQISSRGTRWLETSIPSRSRLPISLLSCESPLSHPCTLSLPHTS